MERRTRRLLLWTIAGTIAALILFVVACDIIVTRATSERTSDKTSEIPYTKYGLLLATSPRTPAGALNHHYVNRMKAAEELFKAGKIDYIIASGGDYSKTEKGGCDEPQAIKDSLIARGVPGDRIIQDYEGTRTLNSIVKAKHIYGLDTVTMISQKYHNERALYLADKEGLYAVGYNAEPSPEALNRFKNNMREYLARVKMFLDIWTGKEANVSGYARHGRQP